MFWRTKMEFKVNENAYKPIKVNYRNGDGKPSSTTISYAIAQHYALLMNPTGKIRDYDHENISKLVQQFVNEMTVKIFDDIPGQAKCTIESELLHKTHYDLGINATNQMNLI